MCVFAEWFCNLVHFRPKNWFGARKWNLHPKLPPGYPRWHLNSIYHHVTRMFCFCRMILQFHAFSTTKSWFGGQKWNLHQKLPPGHLRWHLDSIYHHATRNGFIFAEWFCNFVHFRPPKDDLEVKNEIYDTNYPLGMFECVKNDDLVEFQAFLSIVDIWQTGRNSARVL